MVGGTASVLPFLRPRTHAWAPGCVVSGVGGSANGWVVTGGVMDGSVSAGVDADACIDTTGSTARGVPLMSEAAAVEESGGQVAVSVVIGGGGGRTSGVSAGVVAPGGVLVGVPWPGKIVVRYWSIVWSRGPWGRESAGKLMGPGGYPKLVDLEKWEG